MFQCLKIIGLLWGEFDCKCIKIYLTFVFMVCLELNGKEVCTHNRKVLDHHDINVENL